MVSPSRTLQNELDDIEKSRQEPLNDYLESGVNSIKRGKTIDNRVSFDFAKVRNQEFMQTTNSFYSQQFQTSLEMLKTFRARGADHKMKTPLAHPVTGVELPKVEVPEPSIGK